VENTAKYSLYQYIMEKYNRLCANIDDQINIDCSPNKPTKDDYCNLLHTIYADCVTFHNRKMKMIAEQQLKDRNKKNKIGA